MGSFGTYYPYGEDCGTGNPPADREKFATYTRDSATYQLGLNDPPPGQGTPSLTVASLETRVWFGAKLVTLNGATMTPDRLGSYGTYYPYGEGRTPPAIPNDEEKFATYTRDSATGLDYAVNRYYYNVSGRFMSADPYVNSAGPTEPGSWNRYAYTRGDPTNRLDPFGTCDQSSDTDYSVTVCADKPDLDTAVPTRPNQSARTPLQEAYAYANALRQAVKTLSNYNPCDALADFADGLADAVTTINQFVEDFGVLVPDQFASKAGLLYYNSNPVYLWSSGPSGYSAAFQNTVNDSANGNGDQGHHFAAFFEFGYLHPNEPGGAIATAFEWAEAGFGVKGPVNQGDINLGTAAFNIGASLKNGTIKPSDIGQKIGELCAQ